MQLQQTLKLVREEFQRTEEERARLEAACAKQQEQIDRYEIEMKRMRDVASSLSVEMNALRVRLRLKGQKDDDDDDDGGGMLLSEIDTSAAGTDCDETSEEIANPTTPPSRAAAHHHCRRPRRLTSPRPHYHRRNRPRRGRSRIHGPASGRSVVRGAGAHQTR